jgi:hypothetical protein
MKSNLIHGLAAGVLSGLAGVVYLTIYQELYYVDYSMIINSGAIIGASIIACVLMSIVYFFLEKLKKVSLFGIANLGFMLISFLSIIPPMTMSLPLEVDFPELFPGLVIPMHFFPVMLFFGISPFFNKYFTPDKV